MKNAVFFGIYFSLRYPNSIKFGRYSTKYQQSELGSIFLGKLHSETEVSTLLCLMPCKVITAFAKQTNKPFFKHKKLGMRVLKLPQKATSPYKTIGYAATECQVLHIQLSLMYKKGTLEFLAKVVPWNRKSGFSASNGIMLSSHFPRPCVALQK